MGHPARAPNTNAGGRVTREWTSMDIGFSGRPVLCLSMALSDRLPVVTGHGTEPGDGTLQRLRRRTRLETQIESCLVRTEEHRNTGHPYRIDVRERFAAEQTRPHFGAAREDQGPSIGHP